MLGKGEGAVEERKQAWKWAVLIPACHAVQFCADSREVTFIAS